MRRWIAPALLSGLLLGLAVIVPRAALADAVEECPLRDPSGPTTILEPKNRQVIDAWGGFRLMWTRYPKPKDILWYNVQVFVPNPEVIEPDRGGLLDADDGLGILYRSFRYVPNTDRDARRCHPAMWVDATLLQSGHISLIVVTPMGAGEALRAAYPQGTIPTDLPIENYRALGPPSAPVSIFIDYP